MSDIAIKVENLCFSINGNQILDNVNLEIGHGERVCIIGGSGCGKTILAKHFNGLLWPDSGRAIVYSKDLNETTDEELDEVRKQIGYVFQGNALSSSLDVYSNVSMPIRRNPTESSPEDDGQEIALRVQRTLESVGLDRGYFSRLPHELSGGQRKRVAVARATISNPKMIIYDEPTTGLDPGFARTIVDLILDIHKKSNNTTIVITHEKELMKRIDRIILLRDKRLYFDGSYQTLENSRDNEIRTFLAEKETRFKPEKELSQITH